VVAPAPPIEGRLELTAEGARGACTATGLLTDTREEAPMLGRVTADDVVDFADMGRVADGARDDGVVMLFRPASGWFEAAVRVDTRDALEAFRFGVAGAATGIGAGTAATGSSCWGSA
jgi:hypothetical protein